MSWFLVSSDSVKNMLLALVGIYYNSRPVYYIYQLIFPQTWRGVSQNCFILPLLCPGYQILGKNCCYFKAEDLYFDYSAPSSYGHLYYTIYWTNTPLSLLYQPSNIFTSSCHRVCLFPLAHLLNVSPSKSDWYFISIFVWSAIPCLYMYLPLFGR